MTVKLTLTGSAKTLAVEIRKQYRVSANTKRLTGLELLDVAVNAKNSIQVNIAICGIRYGMATGRLTFQAEKMLKGFTAYQMVNLVAHMADAKISEAEASRFLNGLAG